MMSKKKQTRNVPPVPYNTLLDAIPQLVWTVRSDGSFEYTNQCLRNFFGLTLEQFQRDPWAHRQFFHPEDLEEKRMHWEHIQETGELFEHEQRLKQWQTEGYRWFLTRVLPGRDETGQIVRWFGTSTEIENQKQIEEALRQSQKRANALMQSNIIGIFVCEGEQILDANETFLRMTGYSCKDLRVGRLNWLQMTPAAYWTQIWQARQEMATRQVMTPSEQEFVCKDGSRLPVLVCGSLFEHHPSQAIIFVLDNSARKELDQRKDDVINIVSHELGTPLTEVKIQTQLVRKRLEKQFQHDAASALSRVESPIKRLEHLIAELVDVSKIYAGRVECVQERVDLDELLREVIDTMQHTSPSHTILVRGSVQTSLMGDQDRLRQVFTNLLSNAIKYSPDATTVEVELCASAETATIRVRDHGLGIPHEQHEKIFERFYRADVPQVRTISGLGIGLYIVKQIVKGHGGTITVESDVGKGSTFTVTLPRRRDD